MPVKGIMAALARRCGPAMLAASVMLWAAPASAELAVSQLVVEFKPGSAKTSDIEIANNSPERSYIVVEPREILGAGTAREQAMTTPDPAKLGLLVSPARFILEPGQRRILRIASIGAPSEMERIYRVTVKPVTGEVSGSESGLKLLVGYDLLVLVRPPAVREAVRAARQGSELVLVNDGNASVELAEGKWCDDAGRNCQPLKGKRLYAGASWKQLLSGTGKGEYRLRTANGWSSVKF